MTETTEAELVESLRDVLDPCSCFTQNPVNIVDLGLIEEVSLDNGTAVVSLVLTSPFCEYFPKICEEIDEVLSQHSAVENVEIRREKEVLWSSDRMADEALEQREKTFQRRMEESGVEPYYGETSG